MSDDKKKYQIPNAIKVGKKFVKQVNYQLAKRTDELQFYRLRKGRHEGYLSTYAQGRIHPAHFFVDTRTGERFDQKTDEFWTAITEAQKTMVGVGDGSHGRPGSGRGPEKRRRQAEREEYKRLNGPVRVIFSRDRDGLSA